MKKNRTCYSVSMKNTGFSEILSTSIEFFFILLKNGE